MRIVHLANFYAPASGGLRTAMHALGAGYLERGHEPILIVPGPRNLDEQTPYGRRISVRSPRLPFSGGYRIITNTARVRRLLRQLSPDVIEVSDRTTLRGIGRWARRRGIPAVFFSHERADGVLRANLPRAIASDATVRRLAARHNAGTARRFATIVCTTGFAGEEFDRIGVPWAKVPLGVDLDRFDPRFANEDVRARYASGGEVLLLMASRLSKEKDPGLAIDTVRELMQRGMQLRLVCAGTGNVAEQVKLQARGLPVSFLGFVTDRHEFASLLASADVVLAPGPIETFGLAALEALASGTPVVVRAESALPEVVGTAGVAAPGDPEAFADAVQSLLKRDRYRRRGQARAQAETMPWSATVDTLLALYAAKQPEPVA